MLKSKTKNNLIINNAIELGELTTEANGKGRKFTSRFIEPGLAKYEQFGMVYIPKETLDKFIDTMVGVPVIIKHKDITDANADRERVGVVSRVWYNEADGWYYCEGVLFNKQAIDLVINQGWNVSCTYDFESDFKKGTYHGAEYDMKFTGGEFLHLALVPNPRYERATIVMNSQDDTETIFLSGLKTIIENALDTELSDEDRTVLNGLADIFEGENGLGESVSNADHWITVHPNGKDEKGQPLLVKDGETNKDAIERKFGDKTNSKKADKQETLKQNKEKIEKIKKDIEILRDKTQDTNYTIGERKGFQQEIQQKTSEIQEYKKQNAYIEWEEKKKNWDGKIAGVEKGEPMDFQKADNMAPNPKYEKGTIYSDNCQTCVVAFELRQRGYDVEARGLDTPEAESIMTYTNTAWVDADTGYAPNYIKDDSVKNNKDLYNWLNNTIEENKRYTLQWGWKGKKREGHIASIFKKDNTLILYDPQDGNTMVDKEILKYAQRFKYEISIYRTKMPNPPKLLEVSSYDINFEKVNKILLKASYSA